MQASWKWRGRYHDLNLRAVANGRASPGPYRLPSQVKSCAGLVRRALFTYGRSTPALALAHEDGLTSQRRALEERPTRPETVAMEMVSGSLCGAWVEEVLREQKKFICMVDCLPTKRSAHVRSAGERPAEWMLGTAGIAETMRGRRGSSATREVFDAAAAQKEAWEGWQGTARSGRQYDSSHP